MVTAQFLQDTGAKNSQDLLVYTPSTEVAGLRGNFSGQAGLRLRTARRRHPSNTTRVRGLDSADNTRDYFLTDIPWDSFNSAASTFSADRTRSSSASGSPAGIINNSANECRVQQLRTTITNRFDSTARCATP